MTDQRPAFMLMSEALPRGGVCGGPTRRGFRYVERSLTKLARTLTSPRPRLPPAAFLEGAEERSRDAEGRPLTSEELERVTKRYPEG